MTKAARGLGVALETPPKRFPVGHWAVVDGASVLASGTFAAPRSYSEEEAIAYLSEAMQGAIREHEVTAVFVWGVEPNARMRNALKPRVRTEGAFVAAATLSGATTTIAAWVTIESATGAERDKKTYGSATEVCGLEIGDANPLAVLAAIAATKRS